MWILFTSTTYAQQILEEILTDAADEDTPNIAELVDTWKSTPIDLNRASLAELESFPLISHNLAGRILSKRNQKTFTSFADFITRLNLDAETWQEFEFFFVIHLSRKHTSDRMLEIRLRHEREWPKSDGFKYGKFDGSPSKVYQRVFFHPFENIEGGMLLEKDPGERNWMDHRVGFLEFGTPAQKARLILGHYRIETGQGLVFWNPYRLSAGADPLLTFRSRAGGAKGYLLSDEAHSMFGISSEWRIGPFIADAFYAKSPRDARIEADKITSLPVSGLHRTDSEEAIQWMAKETLWGCCFRTLFPLGEIGLSGYLSAYDREVTPPLSRKYGIIGAHYDLAWKNIRATGEMAFSRSGGRAFIVNYIADFDKIDWIVSLHAFSDRFINPHGNAFCAKANTNEQGVFFGARFDLTPTTTAATSFTLYRRPAPTATLPAPSDGSVWLFLLKKRLNRRNTLSLQYKRKTDPDMRDGWTETNRSIPMIVTRNQDQFRTEIMTRLSAKLRIKSRVEWTRVLTGGLTGDISAPPFVETGVLLFEDIQLRLNRNWTFSARWMTFHTGTYESRIYVYEQDVPGAFSLAPLYGKGNRRYILITCRPVESVRLSMRYEETYHDRAEEWSSGLNRIEGNLERKWTIQTELEF